MVKNQIGLFALAFSSFLFIILASPACSSSRGVDDSAQLANAAMEREKNRSGGQERLISELSIVPQKEQLSDAPVREAHGFYILERQKGESAYKFNSPPAGDPATGSFPPANTFRVALVEYHKVDDGPYKSIDKEKTIPGFRLDADVILIDHTIPAVVLRKSFRGDKPGNRVGDANYTTINASDTEVVGRRPVDKIQKFLDGLPYKK